MSRFKCLAFPILGAAAILVGSLTYARAASEQDTAFTLAIDRPAYDRRPPVMTVRLTLKVVQPVELTFSSGQRFDIEVKNQRGQVVHRWSDGRPFIMIFGKEHIGPGETQWVAEVPLVDRNGNPLDPGRYTVHGWLTSVPAREYSASVGFEIPAAR